MNNTLANQTLNETTIDHLKSCSNIAATISIVILLMFIIQIGFSFYAFIDLSSGYRISDSDLFWLSIALLISLVSTFLLFAFYRDFSDSVALAINEDDGAHFEKSFFHLQRLFILQLVIIIGGPALMVITALVD